LPTRAEQLADHFIRSAGIAGVAIEADGTIVAVDAVSLFDPRDVVCCAIGNQTAVAAIASRRVGAKCGRGEALAAVRAAAAEAGIGLTPFDRVVQRAFLAIETVERTLADLQAAGQLRDFNRDFAARRKADPGLRYQDHLHERKMVMIEALARQGR